MNPYLEAFHLYVKAERSATWTDALDVHFQAGAVICTAEGFVLARRVRKAWDDARHLDLGEVDPAGDCWHVWAAAGNLSWLLALAAETSVEWLSYQRHNEARVRRRRVVQLFNAANGRGVRSVPA